MQGKTRRIFDDHPHGGIMFPGANWVVSAWDCENVARWFRTGVSLGRIPTIIRDLMLAGFCLLFALGCGSTELPSPELQARASELSALLTSSKTVEIKSDEILVAISEVKTRVETLEASLVLPNPNGKEGDPESALDPVPTSPVDDITPIAAGRGYLTSDGTQLRWDVNGNKNPTILETSAHLRTHGINTNGMTHQQMADIHADIHDGKPVATRAVRSSCPNGRCPTSTRQRRGLLGLFR